MDAYPFPVGRFTEDEWFEAYRLTLDDEDATREARFNANITPAEAWRVSIGAIDLAHLSLVSDELAKRVTLFFREIGMTGGPAVPQDKAAVEKRVAEWETFRQHCRTQLHRPQR